MKQAPGFKRFSSYLIDFSLLFGSYYLLLKAGEDFVKPKELYPPVDAMVFYTPRDFEIYQFAATFAAAVCLLYYFTTYVCLNATLGQKLLKIQVLKQNASPLELSDKLKLTMVALLKFSIVFVPGPLLVIFFIYGHVFSFLALLAGLYFLTVNPILAYQKPVKLSWSDKLTGTAIFED